MAKILRDARARKVRGQKENPKIQELVNRIQEEIDSVGGIAVVRLSTRSAKDVILQQPRTKEYFHEELIKFKNNENFKGLSDDALDMLALTRAVGRAMAVTNGRNVVDMFIDSQRIFDDLYTACKSSPPQILSILIRKYIPLATELELRVFVNKSEISAISQYYSSCKVPWFHKNKEMVKTDVFKIVQEIIPIIDLESFVVDFAYDLNGKLWIVEINLPPPLAGMSMFDKHNPQDLKIVKGEAPFEFRLCPIIDDSSKDCREKYRMFFDSLNKKSTKKINEITNKTQRKMSL